MPYIAYFFCNIYATADTIIINPLITFGTDNNKYNGLKSSRVTKLINSRIYIIPKKAPMRNNIKPSINAP